MFHLAKPAVVGLNDLKCANDWLKESGALTSASEIRISKRAILVIQIAKHRRFDGDGSIGREIQENTPRPKRLWTIRKQHGNVSRVAAGSDSV